MAWISKIGDVDFIQQFYILSKIVVEENLLAWRTSVAVSNLVAQTTHPGPKGYVLSVNPVQSLWPGKPIGTLII